MLTSFSTIRYCWQLGQAEAITVTITWRVIIHDQAGWPKSGLPSQCVRSALPTKYVYPLMRVKWLAKSFYPANICDLAAGRNHVTSSMCETWLAEICITRPMCVTWMATSVFTGKRL